MKKLYFCLILVFVLFSITGCEIEDKKTDIVLKYDYLLQYESDYKDIGSRVFDNRSLYVKYKEDNSISNALTSYNQSVYDSQPKYTAQSTSYSNGTVNGSAYNDGYNSTSYNGYYSGSTTTNTQVYEKPKQTFNYLPNYDKASIVIIYLDNYLQFTQDIYTKFKERPANWQQSIDDGIKYYQTTRQDSDKDHNVRFLVANQVNNFTDNDLNYIYGNVFLEDENGNRYKALDVSRVNDSALLIDFNYKVSKANKYIKVVAFDLFQKGNFEFIWRFEEPTSTPSH